ncbi:hypothetical protein JK386_13575 [Nocardioides sp. zg-536]|uniref:Uncharacterized protein n=1 Tax=Nocardioides faecalis TaxID=2803858 RepID=A0A939BTR6_9ACTN|nr:hypothetical protein [Nocardioides faecalis]MBM9460929.1 hypothetical protein [Nocardioides faecalis]QVI59246.1 hypothetical protein KG111_02390 [Nocardioides faecalis]
MSQVSGALRRRLPVDHARANRLTPDDDLFLRARRVLGMPVLNQIVWRFDTEPDPAAVRAVHRGLAAGPWNRLAVAGRVPGARPRWVRGVAAPLRLDAEPVPADAVTAWIEEHAATRLDPVVGPTWELRLAVTETGESLMSLVVGHEVCDGGALIGAVVAAVEGRTQPVLPAEHVQVRLRDDVRDALHLTRSAVHGLRRARAQQPPARDAGVLTSDQQPPSPPRGGADATPYRPASIAVTSPAAEWHRVAAEHGGTANSLLVAVVTEVLGVAGRVPPGASVKVALPVDTRAPGDLRSNATTGVSIVVDTEPGGEPATARVGDLGTVRARARQAFAGLAAGTRIDPMEPLQPLVQLLPDPVVRRVASRIAAPLCLCSNLGRLPEPFAAPFGRLASAVLMRSVTQQVTPDMMRSRRGGLTAWWNQTGDTVTLGLLGMDPDLWPDAASLWADVDRVYDRWGLAPRLW